MKIICRMRMISALLLAPDSSAGGPRLHALHADALALHLECDGDLLRVLEPGHIPARTTLSQPSMIFSCWSFKLLLRRALLTLWAHFQLFSIILIFFWRWSYWRKKYYLDFSLSMLALCSLESTQKLICVCICPWKFDILPMAAVLVPACYLLTSTSNPLLTTVRIF